MLQEPSTKRAFVFIDGQNLFKCARTAFGYTYPNYDVSCLSHSVCAKQGWLVKRISFYTGIHTTAKNPPLNRFWEAKLLAMARQDVNVFSRPLRYRGVGSVPVEKGIDVRMALDMIRAVYRAECDVLVIFSQDQDFSEVADEVRLIAHTQNRWIKIVSAFPVSATTPNDRGINKTDWIRINQTTYDACRDLRDYRGSEELLKKAG